MATPTLKYVAPTTPEANLANKPEPVEIYGIPASQASDISALESRVDDLEARVAALENPAG